MGSWTGSTAVGSTDLIKPRSLKIRSTAKILNIEGVTHDLILIVGVETGDGGRSGEVVAAQMSGMAALGWSLSEKLTFTL
jgi:hypothetical protein